MYESFIKHDLNCIYMYIKHNTMLYCINITLQKQWHEMLYYTHFGNSQDGSFKK